MCVFNTDIVSLACTNCFLARKMRTFPSFCILYCKKGENENVAKFLVIPESGSSSDLQKNLSEHSKVWRGLGYMSVMDVYGWLCIFFIKLSHIISFARFISLATLAFLNRSQVEAYIGSY